MKNIAATRAARPPRAAWCFSAPPVGGALVDVGPVPVPVPVPVGPPVECAPTDCPDWWWLVAIVVLLRVVVVVGLASVLVVVSLTDEWALAMEAVTELR